LPRASGDRPLEVKIKIDLALVAPRERG